MSEFGYLVIYIIRESRGRTYPGLCAARHIYVRSILNVLAFSNTYVLSAANATAPVKSADHEHR